MATSHLEEKKGSKTKIKGMRKEKERKDEDKRERDGFSRDEAYRYMGDRRREKARIDEIQLERMSGSCHLLEA